ncbi:MAG TPA: hypothetical protein DIT04_01050 [Dysgonomonas sp.]|nr:hypothetical protein [Dysgonomonas sp.]
MKKRNLFLILGCLFLIALPGKAQVTIGSDAKPLDGALLQLKENENGATQANSKKGLLLPRVSLTSTTDMSGIEGMSATNQASYKGLLVYNVSTAVPSGTYVWTGDKWHLLENADSFSLTASNGILYSGGAVKLGGALTEATTTITADNKALIFETKNIPLNDPNKGIIIRGLSEQSYGTSKALVADINTGKLGISAVVPASLAFYQSSDETELPQINTGAVQVVPWNVTGSDEIYNNLVDFDAAEQSFVMKEGGKIEISAMLGYLGGGRNPATGAHPIANYQIIVNATLQMKKATAWNYDTFGNPIEATAWETDYTDYSSVRGVYVGAVHYYRNTLNIPPAMAQANVGDKIRLVVLRPEDQNNPGGFLGDTHFIQNRGIVRPWGTKFSKSIKIVLQGP